MAIVSHDVRPTVLRDDAEPTRPGALATSLTDDAAAPTRTPRAALDRAATLCELGRWAEATLAATEAVARTPRDPEAWCLSGRAQLGLGRPQAALQSAQTAATLAPEAEEPHHLASLALEELGLEAEAASAAREATVTAPGSWRAHARLARCLALLKDRLPEAHQAAEQARALAPEEPGPHLAVGAVALAAGRRQDATSAYCAALGLDPQCFEAHSQLAALGDARAGARVRRRLRIGRRVR
jgi:tetratricopeptide (TPR) repeat protein